MISQERKEEIKNISSRNFAGKTKKKNSAGVIVEAYFFFAPREVQNARICGRNYFRQRYVTKNRICS